VLLIRNDIKWSISSVAVAHIRPVHVIDLQNLYLLKKTKHDEQLDKFWCIVMYLISLTNDMDVIMKSKQFHEPCAILNNWDLYNVRNSCRIILTLFGNRHGVILTEVAQHLMSFLSLKIEQHEPPKKEGEFRCSRMNMY
jgi:hypothetical protein